MTDTTQSPRLASPTAARAFGWLSAQLKDWSAVEGGRWIFVARTLVAAFSALWLAYWLALDSPGTAVTTVVLLALPSSGMVLEKSFQRLLGTLVGCAASLVLIALFPQQPKLLFFGLALWFGVCTGGATMLRNAQSYGFVLSGYTACIILVPAVDHPSQVFTLAVTRVCEVVLGIVVSAVVNDALFPRHQGIALLRTVQTRYSDFVSFCHGVLQQRLAPADVELMHLRFAADVAALESGRAAAFFEAGHARADSRQLHAFNASFMATLTTFYTLHRLLQRLRQGELNRVAAALEPLHAMLSDWLQNAALLERPAELHTLLLAELDAARARLGPSLADSHQQLAFDTAADLLDRFARNMSEFQSLYFGLTRNRQQRKRDPLAYTPKTPMAIVIACGVRAAVALGAAAIAAHQLAWPSASTAILMGAIFCGLAASSPRPPAMVKQVLIGSLIAFPLAFLISFFLLPHATGYPMLILSILPVIALGSYLSSRPSVAAVGIGLNMFITQTAIPANVMHLDPSGFLNNGIALIIGLTCVYVVFSVILPKHTMGNREHVARALWREALEACVASGKTLQHRFDNHVRDLLSQLNAAAGPHPDQAARAVVRQALTLLELGHSVIDLRVVIAGTAQGQAHRVLQHCVRQTAAYLRDPRQASCRNAIETIVRSGPFIQRARQRADPARAMQLGAAMRDLHSIYTCLLDQLPQLPGDLHRAV